VKVPVMAEPRLPLRDARDEDDPLRLRRRSPRSPAARRRRERRSDEKTPGVQDPLVTPGRHRRSEHTRGVNQGEQRGELDPLAGVCGKGSPKSRCAGATARS